MSVIPGRAEGASPEPMNTDRCDLVVVRLGG
jgi:hypothetical protein